MQILKLKTGFQYVVFAFLLLVLTSCAQQGSLSGGPRDKIPPRIDTTLSLANYQTNISPKSIDLYFDEWIQLKNQGQILVSPPLQYRPKIKSRGKKVSVIFDELEQLRDSTTYSVNFGNSIVDFTESNPLENFSFVFSTGDVIDSLSLKGTVIDAYTKEPVEDVLVMLYDQLNDSIVYKEKPYYFSKTNKDGLFRINNIRNGKFKCFALLDADYNFIYNQENEQIGFTDSLIYLYSDSLPGSLEIELFLPLAEIQLLDAAVPASGKVKLEMNRELDSFEIVHSNISFFHKEILGDSIIFWYDKEIDGADSIFMAVQYAGKMDTVELKLKTSPPGLNSPYIASDNLQQKKLLPGKNLKLKFDQIIDTVDTSFIKLIDKTKVAVVDSSEMLASDTLPKVIDLQIIRDSLDLRQIILMADLTEAHSYELEILPGGISAYYENENDSLSTSFVVEQKENLGNINCKFDSLNEQLQYIVHLNKKNTRIRTKSISGVKEKEILFDLLLPGKYHLEIIEDINKNGRWDPGDYLKHKQSERKREVKLEEVRKNWDIQSEIKWDK